MLRGLAPALVAGLAVAAPGVAALRGFVFAEAAGLAVAAPGVAALRGSAFAVAAGQAVVAPDVAALLASVAALWQVPSGPGQTPALNAVALHEADSAAEPAVMVANATGLSTVGLREFARAPAAKVAWAHWKSACCADWSRLRFARQYVLAFHCALQDCCARQASR